MSILNEPKNYELINTCNKCGFCQANCSVYKEVLNEAFATRGRIQLIKAVADDKLTRTPYYEKIINSCLMCEECSKNCPSGVQGHLLIQMAREDLAKEKGLPFTKKIAVERVLTNNKIRKLSFKYLSLVNRIAKPIRLTSFRGISLTNIPVAKKDFLSSYKEGNIVKSPKVRVGFFVGCMLNHTLPQVAQSVVRVLEHNGCQVVIPPSQRCCGTPAHTYGHSKVSKKVALFNIQLFSELNVDVIVTACASCGNMLKKYSRIFKDDAEIKEQANAFSSKVRDISQFLVDDLKLSLDEYKKNIPGKITYHDPCHLVRGQNISIQPREILKKVAHGQYVEMPGANKCCGAAGMFQNYFPLEAKGISNKKVNSINKTAAAYVATSCPACYHRLTESLAANSSTLHVLHIVQLLDPHFSLESIG